MAAPNPPSIPPRPVKAQAAAQGVSKLPDIPPRPANKRVERSVSPNHYPRSPLNEPYVLTKTRTAELTARAPSVDHLPTPGEEGMEYANVYNPVAATALSQDANPQTRLVAEDLHLHAPKPSLAQASATAQVQSVTRTDSAQAASHGIGRASHEDLSLSRTRSRQGSRQGYARPDSAASGDRRLSLHDDHGPAELGLRVPINPLLGDVQAPSPHGMSPQTTGDQAGRHSRKKSGAQDFRPPDSYGLHGHGMIANNQFEREWYAKHPDQLEHEEGQGHGVYEGIGSGRGNFALSSDELNKIVRDTASRGSGFGTHADVVSYPDEQIGYNASEVYQRSQQNTPHPEPLSRIQTHEAQPAASSPLRRTSFPAEDAQPAEIRRHSHRLSSQASEPSQEEAIHIDEPTRKFNKLTGGQESINEVQETKPYISHAEDDGREYSVPILAEDEVAKSVGGEHMHAAVSPRFDRFERRHSQPNDEHDRSGAHTPSSRPASRPGSIYQMHSASHSLSRFLSHQDERDHLHTPLEDVAEYEPLFDDNEEKKALTHAERFKKRPDALQKRFPSQDIWEDTPSSAMYVAEVSEPDLPATIRSGPNEGGVSSTFESPEAEHARKGELSEQEKARALDQSPEERLAKSKFAPHLRDDMPTGARPAILAQRFPSRDIWEDTPDSNYLTTTVGPEPEEEESSPTDAKPPVPARPAKSRLGEDASSAQIDPSVAPQIPERPKKYQVPPADAQLTSPQSVTREISPTELKKVPSIPDRPKPQIPPRPKKPSDDTNLTPSSSVESHGESARSKPQVPARPAAGGLAGLKGNFMNDLNKKLGLGPPKEKEPEPEVEAKPLEDARKSRARGPQRRAPAKSPAAAAKVVPQFSMLSARSLWQIDESDELTTVPGKKESEPVAVIDHAVPAEEPKAEVTTLEEAVPGAFVDEDDPEGELTRKTTATTMSGDPIEPEASREEAHVLPASRVTTASDEEQPIDDLEKVPTNEPQPEVKVNEESVTAA